TTAANGKLEILQRKGLDAPLDWIQDATGQPTSDAHGVVKGGALRPLGGDTASHKGYALGAVVDIFSAVLSGANYGPWVPPFVALGRFSDPRAPGRRLALRLTSLNPLSVGEERFHSHLLVEIARLQALHRRVEKKAGAASDLIDNRLVEHWRQGRTAVRAAQA